MRHRSPDAPTTIPAGLPPLTLEDAGLLVDALRRQKLASEAELEAYRLAVAKALRRCQRTVFGGRLANDIIDLLGDLR
jgi:hypothetical protein